MSEVGFVYGVDFQRSVLKFMIEDINFCTKCSSFLREDYFTGELKWFFRKAFQWHDSYQRPPTPEYYQVEILKHDDSSKYEEEFKQILAAKVDKDFIKSEMTSYIRANIFVGSYRQAALLYNNGTKDEAYAFVKEKMELLNRASFDRDRITRFGDYESIVDQASQQIKNAVPTGIQAIDEALLGGMMPQTWTTFLGPSNVGKSMLCPNLAYYAAQAGKKTFVTIHEDEETPTKLRYLARFSGVPYNKLVEPRSFWSKEQKEIVAAADQFLSKFVVMRFMYGRDCFLEDVAEEVRQQKQEFDLSLFLCDYGQCLKSKAFKTMDNDYSIQGYIYGELKQICLELNIAGGGGAQTNRFGNTVNRSGASLLRTTDVGDSFTICKKSSNVITLNRSIENVKSNRVIFLLDKARNGRVPVAVQCVSDFARCTTHIPYDQTQESQQEIEVDFEKRSNE